MYVSSSVHLVKGGGGVRFVSIRFGEIDELPREEFSGF